MKTAFLEIDTNLLSLSIKPGISVRVGQSSNDRFTNSINMHATAIFAFVASACFAIVAAQAPPCLPTPFVGIAFDFKTEKPYEVIEDLEAHIAYYTSLVDGTERLYADMGEILSMYERHADGSCTQYNNTRGGVSTHSSTRINRTQIPRNHLFLEHICVPPD